MKETLDNSQSFEPGDLMSWQEMSRLLKEAIPQTWDAIVAIQAGISDIKTRLDDLEETVGECLQQYKGDQEVIDVPLTDALIENEMRHTFPEETTGAHPPNCRCAWCEPAGEIYPSYDDSIYKVNRWES